MCVCVCVCVCARARARMCLYLHVCVHTPHLVITLCVTQSCLCVYICIYVRVHMRMHVCECMSTVVLYIFDMIYDILNLTSQSLRTNPQTEIYRFACPVLYFFLCPLDFS